MERNFIIWRFNMKRIGMVVAMRKEILPLIENSGVEVFNESVGKYQISYFKYID